MIQRIQTLYILLGTILLMVTCFFVPLIGIKTESSTDLFWYFTVDPNAKMLVVLLIGLNLIATLFTVFTFKKIKIQLYSLSFLRGTPWMILGSALFRILKCGIPQELLDQGYISFDYKYFGFFVILLVGTEICYYLAYRGIKKDDDLIKSIDRIR